MILLVLCSAAAANPVRVLDFEGLATTHFEPSIGYFGMNIYEPVPDGYGDLQWDNFFAYNPDVVSSGVYLYGGYPHGVISGSNAIHNAFGVPATVNSASPFVFESAVVTMGSVLSDVIIITGYRNGVLAGWEKYGAGVSPRRITPSFGPVTEIVFQSERGQNFVIDDFAVASVAEPLKASSAIPEPSTATLFLAALTMFAALRFKR
jgi:hypothetical protein